MPLPLHPKPAFVERNPDLRFFHFRFLSRVFSNAKDVNPAATADSPSHRSTGT